MKSFPDKLREMPIDKLQHRIKIEKQNLALLERDIYLMERILSERVNNTNKEKQNGFN